MQIVPPTLEQPKGSDNIQFMDLDSFELTMEEIELQEIEPEYEDERLDQIPEEGEFEDQGEMEDYEGMEGEHVDDWYYTMNQMAQVGEFSLPKEISKISEQVCIVEPNYVPNVWKDLEGLSMLARDEH